MIGRRATGRALSLLTCLALGCPGPGEVRPPDPTAPDPTTDAAVPDPVRCGDAATVFADAAALPAEATLVALLANDAALADALGLLEAHARGGASGLAVPTAFALGQWPWEVPLVLRSFASVGVTTGSLLAVQLDAGRVWAAPLGCDLEGFVAGLGDAFDVDDLGGAAIATPRDRTRFAHDIVVRPDAIVLCAAGRGRRVLAAWDRPHAANAGMSLRQHAFELAPAPIRLAIRETGLLGSGAGDSTTSLHLVRVDGTGVDATLAP